MYGVLLTKLIVNDTDHFESSAAFAFVEFCYVGVYPLSKKFRLKVLYQMNF
jgi:hypothetical protein